MVAGHPDEHGKPAAQVVGNAIPPVGTWNPAVAVPHNVAVDIQAQFATLATQAVPTRE